LYFYIAFCSNNNEATIFSLQIFFKPRIWSQFRQRHKLRNSSMLSPLCNNHLFPAGKIDFTYAQWQRVGLARCRDFYINNTFASFNNLSEKFQLSQSSLFRYLQVRHFVQSQSSTFPDLPPTSLLDTILLSPTSLKGQIATIYSTVMSSNDVLIDRKGVSG